MDSDAQSLSDLRLLLGYVNRLTIAQRFGKDRVNRQFEPELGCAIAERIAYFSAMRLNQLLDNEKSQASASVQLRLCRLATLKSFKQRNLGVEILPHTVIYQ